MKAEEGKPPSDATRRVIYLHMCARVRGGLDTILGFNPRRDGHMAQRGGGGPQRSTILGPRGRCEDGVYFF